LFRQNALGLPSALADSLLLRTHKKIPGPLPRPGVPKRLEIIRAR